MEQPDERGGRSSSNAATRVSSPEFWTRNGHRLRVLARSSHRRHVLRARALRPMPPKRVRLEKGLFLKCLSDFVTPPGGSGAERVPGWLCFIYPTGDPWLFTAHCVIKAKSRRRTWAARAKGVLRPAWRTPATVPGRSRGPVERQKRPGRTKAAPPQRTYDANVTVSSSGARGVRG